MIVGLCRVSFTPVRARDTVKLIEPKHSFACGSPPKKKTRPKNQVINMLHVKACCCCQWVVVFFIFILLCNGEETAAESKIPSPPLLVCQYVLYVCVLCMRERESEQRDHKRSAAVEVDYEAVKIKQQPSAASFFFRRDF